MVIKKCTNTRKNQKNHIKYTHATSIYSCDVNIVHASRLLIHLYDKSHIHVFVYTRVGFISVIHNRERLDLLKVEVQRESFPLPTNSLSFIRWAEGEALTLSSKKGWLRAILPG